MVTDDNHIVATASVILEKKLRYNRLCCHIEDVAVHPKFRGKGYGKAMVLYCVRIANENKCYKIKLNCDKNLVSFYNKLGFSGHEDHLYLQGENL